MSFVWPFLQSFGGVALPLFLAATVCMTLEWLRPANACSLGSRLRGFRFWLFATTLSVTLLVAVTSIVVPLALRPLALVRVDELMPSGSTVVQVIFGVTVPIVAAIIGDFFYYWMHRLQHRSQFLWRFHRVHHAPHELSAWNSNGHFTEALLYIPFVALPNVLLLSIQYSYVPSVVAFLLVMHGVFIHSCTRFHLGPLRYVIIDNRYHRIHHSIDSSRHGANFGNFTAIWDIVFGTAHFPRAKEWPDTGVAGLEEPRRLSEFLFSPFRRSPRGE